MKNREIPVPKPWSPVNVFLVVGVIALACLIVTITYLVGIGAAYTSDTTTSDIPSTSDILSTSYIPSTFPGTNIPSYTGPSYTIPIVFTSQNGWTQGATFGTNIQAKVDEIFSLQQNNEFGVERYALLFTPGTYSISIRVGYYTSVIGLGATPDDVTINGVVECLNKPGDTGALCNFWRSCENVRIDPPDIGKAGKANYWRVSQASPMRRVHVMGNLYFAEVGGWSSGGFLSDSIVEGNCFGQTQQQWMCRNVTFNNWYEGSWNMVALGCSGGTPTGPMWSTIKETPIIAVKPYLIGSSIDTLQLVRPKVQTKVSGSLLWLAGADEVIDTSDIYFSKFGDTEKDFNPQLAKGKHLVLFPGVYILTDSIVISVPGTVVLGIGLATLTPNGGAPCIVVQDDATGVRIAGLVLDAGTSPNVTMCQVGTHVQASGNVEDPTILQDIAGRVGGRTGQATSTTIMEINQNGVILDQVWLWRADHGTVGTNTNVTGGLGMDNAVCDHALVVNSNDVRAYCLMTEHTLKELVLWNGDRGEILFYQSELAYDVATQKGWDYPALRIQDNVTEFNGVGLGVYSFFSTQFSSRATPQKQPPSVTSAIICPVVPGISINKAMTVLLNAGDGDGEIEHVINGSGNVSNVLDADKPQTCSLINGEYTITTAPSAVWTKAYSNS